MIKKEDHVIIIGGKKMKILVVVDMQNDFVTGSLKMKKQ